MIKTYTYDNISWLRGIKCTQADELQYCIHMLVTWTLVHWTEDHVIPIFRYTFYIYIRLFCYKIIFRNFSFYKFCHISCHISCHTLCYQVPLRHFETFCAKVLQFFCQHNCHYHMFMDWTHLNWTNSHDSAQNIPHEH